MLPINLFDPEVLKLPVMVTPLDTFKEFRAASDPDAAGVISKLTHEARAMGMSFGFTIPKNGEPTRLLLSLKAWGANSKADAKAKAKAISERNKKK